MTETTTTESKSAITFAAVTVYAALMTALIADRATLRAKFGMRTLNN